MAFVETGRALTTTRRGIKGPGEEVKPEDFAEGVFGDLISKGYILENKKTLAPAEKLEVVPPVMLPEEDKAEEKPKEVEKKAEKKAEKKTKK